jgi:hypothetical protein
VKLEGALPVPSSSWMIYEGKTQNHVARIGPNGGFKRTTSGGRRVGAKWKRKARTAAKRSPRITKALP